MITNVSNCPVCDKWTAEYRVYVDGTGFIYFHKDCWKAAGGGNCAGFTKEKWLEFAGEQFEVAEKYCITFFDGSTVWYKGGRRIRMEGP